jgi:hypothetical protein
MNDEEHHFVIQRRKIHEAITEILHADPEYERTHAFVKGWVLVLDLSGLTPEDDESVVDEVRGQPWADIDLWCADATGESDLPTHSGEGLLRYAAAHYEDIYDSRPANVVDDEEEDED